MYSVLVEKLVQSLNAKDLILSGTVFNSELTIFGACRLDNLEHNLQALAIMREMWTPDTTIPKSNSVIDVRIRNINAAVSPEMLDYHPILCTVDLENLDESLVVVPQLN